MVELEILNNDYANLLDNNIKKQKLVHVINIEIPDSHEEAIEGAKIINNIAREITKIDKSLTIEQILEKTQEQILPRYRIIHNAMFY